MRDKNDKNNLIFLSPGSAIGGAETSLIMLIKGLRENAFNSTVLLSTEGAFTKRLKDENIEYHCLEGINWDRRHPKYLIPDIWKITGFAIRKKAKAIIANIYTSNKHAVIAAKFCGARSVCYPCDILGGEEFSCNLIGYADYLVAASNAAYENFCSLGRPKQKIEMIYNAIDPKFFVSDKKDKSFLKNKGIPENAFIIGVVSAIWKPKGQHVILQALPKILKEAPNAHLLIVGGSRDRDTNYIFQLHKMAWELGVSSQVVFTGPIDDVRTVYDSLDLLVFPTLKETFGIVLIEAMAMEVPVVASAVGGIPEVVKDGVNGLLVQPEDQEALANAVLRLIRNSDYRKDLAEKGRKSVERKFSINEYNKSSGKLFRNICEKK